jgi:hypothetical protein
MDGSFPSYFSLRTPKFIVRRAKRLGDKRPAGEWKERKKRGINLYFYQLRKSIFQNLALRLHNDVRRKQVHLIAFSVKVTCFSSP